MPRARFVHPETMTDAKFAEFSREARLFFIYMLCLADDAGNFPDDARELKVKVYPYDNDILTPDIVDFLHQFTVRSMYLRYTFGECSLYHIKNFAKYQKPEYATAPKYPLYPGQKYTFYQREKGKWVKRTVVAEEWNKEVYGERTVSVRQEVRLGEVSKTEPKPNRPTTEKALAIERDRALIAGLDASALATGAHPAEPVVKTAAAKDPSFIDPEDPKDRKIVEKAIALGIPVGKKTPRYTVLKLLAAKDHTQVDLSNQDHYELVKTLEAAGVDTDPIETFYGLLVAVEEQRSRVTT